MRRRACSVIIMLMLVMLGLAPAVQALVVVPSPSPVPHLADATVLPGATGEPNALEHLATIGARFIENHGQFPDTDVLFHAWTPSGRVALLRDGILINLMDEQTYQGNAPVRAEIGNMGPDAADVLRTVTACTVRLTFEGARDVTPRGVGPLPGYSNFIIGNEPSRWAVGVPSFASVVYEDLYEGIDLALWLDGAGFKYEYRLAPGADPASITVRVEGQDSLSIAAGRALVISTGAGDVRDDGLVSYYRDGPDERIDCAFELRTDDTYGFMMPSWDRDKPIVIDPFVYCTYLGGSSDDGVLDSTSDRSGNSYLCGATESSDFPTVPGAYQTNATGKYDGYITKLNPDGDTIVFSTYLGGSGTDHCRGLSITDSGGIYLCGATASQDFPVTAGSLQTLSNCTESQPDGFVCNLSDDGKRLLYSTYIGAEGYDRVNGIAVDGSGRAFVTGYTDSSNFSVTPSAFQTHFSGYYDAFVCAIDADGGSYIYSTYLGGTGEEWSYRIAIDTSGYAYVCGSTFSRDFPTTVGAYKESTTSFDAVLTKLSPDGSSLVYSTYLGGTGDDESLDLAVDSDGCVHLVGHTTSTDFPTTSGCYQPDLTGKTDAFVTRFSADGSDLISSTFLGGAGTEAASAIALDDDNRVYVCGSNSEKDFPTTSNSAQETAPGGAGDGFMSRMSANYSVLEYSTYIGGRGGDIARSIGLDADGYAYVTGYTTSDDLPVTPGAHQTSLAGNYDLFITKLPFDLIPPFADAGADITVDQHQTVELNGTPSRDDVGIVNFSWTFDYQGEPVALNGPVVTYTFDDAGVYNVILTVMDAARNNGTDLVNVTVRDITRPVADAGPDIIVNQSQTVEFNGSMSWDNMGVSNWTWSFRDGGVLVTLQNAISTYIFKDVGYYPVELTVTDASGLWAMDLVNVTVLDTTGPSVIQVPTYVADQHEVVTFDSSNFTDNVGIVNLTWWFIYEGHRVTLYGPAPSFLFDEAGLYIINVTARDAAGNTGVNVTTIRVMDTTAPVARAGDDATISPGETFGFDGGNSTDNAQIGNWTWRFEYEGAPVELVGVEVGFRFDRTGIYTVTLTVLDIEGNAAMDELVVLVVDTIPPEANAGEDIEVNQNVTTTFDGSRSRDNVGITNLTWTFEYQGHQVVLFGTGPEFRFDDAGKYEVILAVTDALGNVGTDSVVVTVRDVTAPTADGGPVTIVDQGQDLILDASGSTDNVAVVSWTWTFEYQGAPITLSGETTTFTPATAGLLNITLTVADAEGNTDSMSLTVRVRDTEDPTAIGPEDMPARLGEEVLLDGSLSTDNVGVVRWTWTFRDGGTDVTLEGRTASYSFNGTGDHVVTLTVTDAEGNTASDTFTMTVKASGSTSGMSAVMLVVVVVIAAVVIAVAVMRRRRKPTV